MFTTPEPTVPRKHSGREVNVLSPGALRITPGGPREQRSSRTIERPSHTENPFAAQTSKAVNWPQTMSKLCTQSMSEPGSSAAELTPKRLVSGSVLMQKCIFYFLLILSLFLLYYDGLEKWLPMFFISVRGSHAVHKENHYHKKNTAIGP